MPETPSRPRPARPTLHLTVVAREWISPSTVRVVMHSDDFEPNGHADAYLKFYFSPTGPLQGPIPERAITRTYTVRDWDPVKREVTVDFVVHGDEGLAGPWAQQCTPGEEIMARGPGGKWSPPQGAQFHLFVGDEAALPAIESGLARLHPDARGLVVVETAAHTRHIAAPPGVDVRWVVRGDQPYREERLAEAVQALPWEEFGDVSVFAHGERGAVRALRPVFRELGLGSDRLSISGYWAMGRIEDQFQAEKKTRPELS